MATKLPDGILIENWTHRDVVFVDHSIGVEAEIIIRPSIYGPAHVQLFTEMHDGSRYLLKTTKGEVTRVPEARKEEGETVYFIVSSLVKQAYPDREDFVIPYRTLRNEQGEAIGCRAFAI